MHERFTAIFCLFLLAPTTALAEPAEHMFAVSGVASTLGLGVEVSRSFAGHTQLRAGINQFDYSYDDIASGIDYELDLRLDSVSLLFDWHPGGYGFRLTSGVLVNRNEVVALGKAADDYAIGDLTFSAEQVGTLNGRLEFDEYAPMIGVGYDSSFADRRFGISLGVGVVFQGAPRVLLDADGPLASEPLFEQELEKERAEFQQIADDYELYPVASLGLSLRF